MAMRNPGVLPVLVGLPFWLIAAFARAGDMGCNRVVGDWSWFIGGTVAFAAVGTAKWTPAVTTIPPATATWTCQAQTGVFKVTWQNGFVDTLNLSEDGARLSGVSSTGVKVTGSRIGAASKGSATTSSSSTTRSNPSTQDGWTPIGNSGFGKQSTVPIGPKGPQPIGPQGRPPPKGAG